MNMLDEQDSYWVANTFIWNWLLLPALPLAELLKQDSAGSSDEEKIPPRQKLTAYVLILGGIFILWAALYPAWEPFLLHVLNADTNSIDLIMSLLHILVPCYAGFVLGSLANALFYAFGRTEFLALGTFLVNLLLIGLFLLMIFEVISASVYAVAGIFGAGLILGAIVSLSIYFLLFLRRHPII